MKAGLLKYAGYRVKARMRDGRWMEGTLLSADCDSNIILDDAEEFRTGRREKDTVRRFLGLVVVRGDFVVDVQVLSKPALPHNK